MVFGITGNTNKDTLWTPVEHVVDELGRLGHPFRLHADVARGLVERGRLDAKHAGELHSDDLTDACDLILSFGGDGTLLNTAAEVGDRGTPILGVNIGRLGFLAHLEASRLSDALKVLADGDYTIEPRMVLDARAGDTRLPSRWALNECAIQRSRESSLLAVDADFDGVELNSQPVEATMNPIHTSDAPRPAGHYSQAMVHGDLVFVSGQLPIDPATGTTVGGSIEDQTRRTLDNVAAVLRAAGSDLSRTIKTTVYVADIRLWGRVNAVYEDVFGSHRPARAVVPVPELHHGVLVEIEAIGTLG